MTLDIGVIQIKAWDRDNGDIEKFDINISDQADIKMIMEVLSAIFISRSME